MLSCKSYMKLLSVYSNAVVVLARAYISWVDVVPFVAYFITGSNLSPELAYYVRVQVGSGNRERRKI